MIDGTTQILTGFPFEGAMGWTAGWLIRGSLFLSLLVLLAGPLARARSSSVRHLLWAAGFAAAVVLPIASIGLPRLEVSVPASILPAVPASAPGFAEWSNPQVREASTESDFGSLVRGEGVEGGSALREGRSALENGVAGWDLSRLPLLLFLLWMAGAAFFLLRFLASMAGTEGIVSRADRVGRPEWERALFELSDRMDLARAPRLVESDEVALPMTCGLFRPTIVIPRSATEWSQERLEAVLCHELAHIRRRDLLSHALGHVGSALYWVNPFTWKAARHLRTECERACDDLVLSLGYRPSAYADHLLQIATFGHRSAAPVAALPMARPGEFEQRLLSILAPKGDRSPLKGWRAAAFALCVLSVAVPFAVLAPAAASGASAALAPTPSAPPSAQSDTLMAKGTEEHGIRVSIATEEHDILVSIGKEEHEELLEIAAVEQEIHHSDESRIDLEAVLDFEALSAFVHGVTSFAGAVASDAVNAAFRDWDPMASVSIGASSQDQVEGTFERTLALSGPLALEIGTGSGTIEIREGSVNRVEIRGRVRVGTRRRGSAGAEEAMRRLLSDPPIEQSGNSVRVGRIEDRSLQDDVAISYEVVVPVQSSIIANTGSGGVTIGGVQGDVQARTGSGSVTLATIRGKVYARTGSGSIRASQITGPFDGGTGSGSIDLTLQGAGDVSLTTGSGSIEATGVRGALLADSGSGRIIVDGEMLGRWELRTGSGSVTVGLPPQASFNLIARAGSGRVNIEHPLTIQGRVDERMREVTGTVRGGGPELNIRTGSGGIQID